MLITSIWEFCTLLGSKTHRQAMQALILHQRLIIVSKMRREHKAARGIRDAWQTDRKGRKEKERSAVVLHQHASMLSPKPLMLDRYVMTNIDHNSDVSKEP
jgi:hypothetical protein